MNKKKARKVVIKPPHEPFLIVAEANVQYKFLRMCHIQSNQTSLFLAVFSFVLRLARTSECSIVERLL